MDARRLLVTILSIVLAAAIEALTPYGVILNEDSSDKAGASEVFTERPGELGSQGPL